MRRITRRGLIVSGAWSGIWIAIPSCGAPLPKEGAEVPATAAAAAVVPSGAPGDAWSANFPPTYLWSLYDCHSNEIAQAAKDKVANSNISEFLDWVGAFNSGPGWYDANVAAKFMMIVGPGRRQAKGPFESPEYSSNTIALLKDPRVIAFTTTDEPGGGGGPTAQELIARFNGWIAQAEAAHLPMKPILITLPAASQYYAKPAGPGEVRIVDIPTVGIWASDEYGWTKPQGAGEDVGLRGTADFGDAFTSTTEGFMLHMSVYGPAKSGQTRTFGKPYLTWVGTNSIEPSKRSPLAGEVRRSIFSNVIMGGAGIALFTTLTNTPKGNIRYQWSPGMKDEFRNCRRRIGLLESRGFLIRAGGGRIPVKPRLSVPAARAPNNSVPAPANRGATGAPPTGSQLPYGFEGVELWNEAHSDRVLLISNFTADPRTLTDRGWDIRGLAFEPYEVKCLKPDLSGFADW